MMFYRKALVLEAFLDMAKHEGNIFVVSVISPAKPKWKERGYNTISSASLLVQAWFNDCNMGFLPISWKDIKQLGQYRMKSGSP